MKDSGPRATCSASTSEPASGLHKSVRLSLEHRAILQGFPPGFVFHGDTEGSKDRQCGNAVPPQLGEALGRSLAEALQAR